MKSIILIAPPAAGKGTEAAILKERLQYREKYLQN